MQQQQLDYPVFLDEPLSVVYQVYPPDKRRRDLSNILKALEDSLNGFAWTDDYQISQFIVHRKPSSKPGKVVVSILRASNANTSDEGSAGC